MTVAHNRSCLAASSIGVSKYLAKSPSVILFILSLCDAWLAQQKKEKIR